MRYRRSFLRGHWINESAGVLRKSVRTSIKRGSGKQGGRVVGNVLGDGGAEIGSSECPPDKTTVIRYEVGRD